MAVTIPDETLHAAGLTDREALIEIDCHLFDINRLEKWPAAKLAGLTRTEFESECLKRNIAIYRFTVEDLERDLKTLKEMGEQV